MKQMHPANGSHSLAMLPACLIGACALALALAGCAGLQQGASGVIDATQQGAEPAATQVADSATEHSDDAGAIDLGTPDPSAIGDANLDLPAYTPVFGSAGADNEASATAVAASVRESVMQCLAQTYPTLCETFGSQANAVADMMAPGSYLATFEGSSAQFELIRTGEEPLAEGDYCTGVQGTLASLVDVGVRGEFISAEDLLAGFTAAYGQLSSDLGVDVTYIVGDSQADSEMPPGAPMATYNLMAPATDGYQHLRIEVLLQPGNGMASSTSWTRITVSDW